MFPHKIIRPCLIVILTLGLGMALGVGPAYAGGGHILPPTAKPHGYSLEQMAVALAKFTESQNNLNYYPDTPFQILYGDSSTGTNTFTVRPGTKFFVPIFNVTDSPPLLGVFPTDGRTAVAYVFDTAQLGGSDFTIAVDGNITPVGPAYLAGPVLTPELPLGGSHALQLGVFLNPLPKGTHTVTISGYFNGDLLGNPEFRFAFTYTVIVS